MKTYHFPKRTVTRNIKDPRSKGKEPDQTFRLGSPNIPITTQSLQGGGIPAQAKYVRETRTAGLSVATRGGTGFFPPKPFEFFRILLSGDHRYALALLLLLF